MAELNRCGISTVLTADTNVEVSVCGSTKSESGLHKATNTNLVELCEGIVLKDLSIIVSCEELSGIVTGEAVYNCRISFWI